MSWAAKFVARGGCVPGQHYLVPPSGRSWRWSSRLDPGRLPAPRHRRRERSELRRHPRSVDCRVRVARTEPRSLTTRWRRGLPQTHLTPSNRRGPAVAHHGRPTRGRRLETQNGHMLTGDSCRPRIRTQRLGRAIRPSPCPTPETIRDDWQQPDAARFPFGTHSETSPQGSPGLAS